MPAGGGRCRASVARCVDRPDLSSRVCGGRGRGPRCLPRFRCLHAIRPGRSCLLGNPCATTAAGCPSIIPCWRAGAPRAASYPSVPRSPAACPFPGRPPRSSRGRCRRRAGRPRPRGRGQRRGRHRALRAGRRHGAGRRATPGHSRRRAQAGQSVLRQRLCVYDGRFQGQRQPGQGVTARCCAKRACRCSASSNGTRRRPACWRWKTPGNPDHGRAAGGRGIGACAWLAWRFLATTAGRRRGVAAAGPGRACSCRPSASGFGTTCT